MLVVACLVVGAVGLFGRDLVRDLVSGAFSEAAVPARPLSLTEAERLAQMRQRNWDDARAGVHATIGSREDEVHAVGWLDWRRPVIYLALSGDQPGVVTTLVQAVPGLVATRANPSRPPLRGSHPPMPEPPALTDAAPATGAVVIDPHPPPPERPPTDGWRVRRPGAAGSPGAAGAPGTLDTLVTLLFSIAADGMERAGEVGGAADLLARSDSRWLRRDRTGGYEVDVLLGPAAPPTPGPDPKVDAAVPSLATLGGAVQYWLDDEARLHRLDALLAAGTPVRVDLDRADRTAPPVLDALGGAAIDPRPVTAAEAEILAGLRQRNQEAGGGELALTVPGDEATVRATGWLDWRRPAAYLVSSTYGTEADDELLWADLDGVATRPAGRADGGQPGGRPPVPAQWGDGWQRVAWEQRGDSSGGFDLELLLNEALALSGWDGDDAGALRERAVWLGTGTWSGTPVTGYEIPRDFELAAEIAPGEARMRYWIDEGGVLRRLELRTRSGGFAQLDLTPAPVPFLG